MVDFRNSMNGLPVNLSLTRNPFSILSRIYALTLG